MACGILSRCSTLAPPAAGAAISEPQEATPLCMHTSNGVQTIPETWQPQVALLSLLPDEIGMQDVELELFAEEDGHGSNTVPPDICNPDVSMQRPTNSSANGPIENMDFVAFVSTLKSSYNKVLLLRSWVQSHVDAVESLTPAEMSTLFEIFKSPDSQVEVATQLHLFRKEISCQHIVGAVSQCLELCKGNVLKILCSIRIVDLQNVHLIKDNVSPLIYAACQEHLPV